MTPSRTLIGSCRDQDGVALVLALITLLTLAAFGLAFLALGSSESVIAGAHSEVARARYLAESGIEWAYDRLVAAANWNTALLGPDGLPNTADDGQLAVSLPLPGLSAAFGTFTVTVRNDSQAGDNQITGVPPDPGGAFNDTNGRVIVTSVGAMGAARRTIRTALRRINLPPMSGALSLPGNEAETTFNGNSFTVNGNDTNLDDTPGPGAPVFGIAVAAGNTVNERVVESSLAAFQKDNVTGKKQNPAQPAYGDNTIAPDPQLTSAAVTAFINGLKAQADLTLPSTLAAPLVFTNIGASCVTNWNSPTCWGTRAKPKMVYVKGQPDPTSMFTALRVSGNTTGAGILIVEDGDFRIYGNFRWEGIIIVTGQWVGIGYFGGGGQSVYGAVFSNETASDPGFREGVIAGNAKINYSSEAVDLARRIRKLVVLVSWQEL